MPARVFYTSTAAAPYSPATFRGAWDDTSGSVSKHLTPVKAGAGATLNSNVAATIGDDELFYRFVSDALAAQTIDGAVDLCFRWTTTGSHQFDWHVHAFVTEGDSDVVRGTLLNDYVGSSFVPTSTNTGYRLDAAQTLSSVVASSGDRLVVEIGVRRVSGGLTSLQGAYGGTGHDLLEGESGGSSVPWIAFSNPIFFAGETVTAVAATHVGTRFAISPSGSDMTLEVPPLVEDGDVLFAIMAADSNNPTAITPTGWDVVSGPLDSVGNDARMTLFTRVANNEPSSYVFGDVGAAATSAVIVAYRGVDPLDPIESLATASPASGTSPTSGSVTTIGAARTIVLFAVGDLDTATLTSPAAMSRVALVGSASTAFIDVADTVEDAAGSYSYSAGLSSADTLAMILVALTPDGEGTAQSSRLAQLAVEVLGAASDPTARLAQMSVEALVAASDPEARFALFSIEVLASESVAPSGPGARSFVVVVG
jgi:hypothetical protein